jgi:hypothetical protein
LEYWDKAKQRRLEREKKNQEGKMEIEGDNESEDSFNEYVDE